MTNANSNTRNIETKPIEDKIILWSTFLTAFASIALGFSFYSEALAVSCSVVFLTLALLGYRLTSYPNYRFIGRILLTFAISCSIALHIQLSRGASESHFGIFVTLALLLIYRDWRPIVISASFFAVHHIVFDRLQAQGFNVYCITEPDLLKISIHASYVVVQTILEVIMATWMKRLAAAGDELQTILKAIDRDDCICLDVSHINTKTPEGLALRHVVSRIDQTLSQVQGSIVQVANASKEIASGTFDLSVRTESSATNIQEASALMVRLNEIVNRNNRCAREANSLAQDACVNVSRGGDIMSNVVVRMQEINAETNKIGEINSVVDQIAFQTNILALNASVEASRAGEHGRGFAVVASEVRNLAQRSAAAAKEIKVLIDQSVDRVKDGSQLVTKASGTMNEIVESITKVSSIVANISDSSNEQSIEIQHVVNAVANLDQSIQQNAALVEQSASATESLKDQAQTLQEAISKFELAKHVFI